MSVRRPGFVTGLASEARCLSPSHKVAVCGARPDQARRMAAELIEQGCDGLVSFGTAGGLDPDLKPGSLVLAARIITLDGTTYAVDEDWRRSIASSLAGYGEVDQVILGLDHPLADTYDKKRLFEQTGAGAVDMESHAVAEVAARHNIPFLVVRVVADTAKTSLPPWTMDLVRPDGRTDTGAVIKGLLRHPAALSSLITLGRQSAAAHRQLRRVALVFS